MQIPGNVTNIADGAFYECSYLPEVTISDGVICIGSEAFAYGLSLNRVTVGKTVRFIEDKAFTECIHLTNVLFYENAPKLGGMKVPASQWPAQRAGHWPAGKFFVLLLTGRMAC